jgi:hypothetical protein
MRSERTGRAFSRKIRCIMVMRVKTYSGVLVTFVAVLLVLLTGVAGAQSDATVEPSSDILALEAQATDQGASVAQGVAEISTVGSSLEVAQAEVNAAGVRSRELDSQAQELQGQLAGQQQNFERSKAAYRDQAKAAYKGKNIEGLATVLGSVLGKDGDVGALADARVARILTHGRQSLDEYQTTRRKLNNTLRQVSKKRVAYGNSREKEQQRVAELRLREERLESAVSRIREDRIRTNSRITKLREAERERILRTRPATGAPAVQRQRELRIARQEIFAQPVEQISKKQYKKLYQSSAKKYGFGSDWYILAAVGKVESNHGENMGPSSAGAMGPMQFMPSTWKTSGVDGNGDGVANVMDPRDAIPAAARYLKTGGAPSDWYAALFSYNHADWYVKKVLGVAEGYRRLAGDERVLPYS